MHYSHNEGNLTVSIETRRLERGGNVKRCLRNKKYIGVWEERAVSSFLEDGVNVFLRNLDTNFPDYTLL